MKRIIRTSLIVLTSLAVLVWGSLQFSAVQDVLMEKQLDSILTADPSPLFDSQEGQPDALKILVCGAGSPFSADATGPCLLVITGNTGWLFDSGNGSTLNMRRWRVPLENVRGVFITHFHSDHIADIGELNTVGWIAGRQMPLSVYGPPGTQSIVSGFNTIYQFDRRYREEHHTKALMNSRIAKIQAKPLAAGLEGVNKVVPVEDGDLKITAFTVLHAPVTPALGYRVDYKGRSVVISGDTIKSSNLIANSLNADVLFHDALSTHMVDAVANKLKEIGNTRQAQLAIDVKDYHASTEQAAQAANTAQVAKLMFYHTVPTPPANSSIARKIFMRGVSDVRDDVGIATDGMLITLPTGSKDIHIEQLYD